MNYVQRDLRKTVKMKKNRIGMVEYLQNEITSNLLRYKLKANTCRPLFSQL